MRIVLTRVIDRHDEDLGLFTFEQLKREVCEELLKQRQQKRFNLLSIYEIYKIKEFEEHINQSSTLSKEDVFNIAEILEMTLYEEYFELTQSDIKAGKE